MSDDIRSLSEVLNEMFRKYNMTELLDKAELIEKYNELVGPAIAANSDPVKFENGILTIKVKNPAWKNELFLMRENIKESINKTLKKEIINEIKLI